MGSGTGVIGNAGSSGIIDAIIVEGPHAGKTLGQVIMEGFAVREPKTIDVDFTQVTGNAVAGVGGPDRNGERHEGEIGG